jgi:Tfp pilus assembly protein PilO
MKRNELTILLSLAVVGMIAAFWLLVISPKRDEAAGLQKDIDGLRSSLEQAQQTAAAGEQARKDFRVNYRSLVVLGKAVPADGDQAGLLVQLQRRADRAGVEFQSIGLTSNAQSTSAPTAPPASSDSSESPTPPETDSGEDAATSTASTTTAPTEATAATLPIGAAVGPAGLPIMPYDLKFTGDFFEIASFLKSLDEMVEMPRSEVDVTGRLLTVDGFALAPEQNSVETSSSTIPTLTANLSVTSYLTPAEQETTAGATLNGPAPATPASTSSTTSTPVATGTASAASTP